MSARAIRGKRYVEQPRMFLDQNKIKINENRPAFVFCMHPTPCALHFSLSPSLSLSHFTALRVLSEHEQTLLESYSGLYIHRCLYMLKR